jgi:drug/metabolite transporter (DMT)-like permease
MVALAGVAAMIAFFVVCWVAIGVSAAAGDQLVLPVFFFGLLAAAIAVFYLFFLWARKRWRRDVGAK